jgi:hypothetical protein
MLHCYGTGPGSRPFLSRRRQTLQTLSAIKRKAPKQVCIEDGSLPRSLVYLLVRPDSLTRASRSFVFQIAVSRSITSRPEVVDKTASLCQEIYQHTLSVASDKDIQVCLELTGLHWHASTRLDMLCI